MNDYNFILYFYYYYLPKIPDIKLDCEVTKKKTCDSWNVHVTNFILGCHLFWQVKCLCLQRRPFHYSHPQVQLLKWTCDKFYIRMPSIWQVKCLCLQRRPFHYSHPNLFSNYLESTTWSKAISSYWLALSLVIR